MYSNISYFFSCLGCFLDNQEYWTETLGASTKTPIGDHGRQDWTRKYIIGEIQLENSAQIGQGLWQLPTKKIGSQERVREVGTMAKLRRD
ncbi:unnamed protein product [Malus baccata var. baccata]